MATPTAPLTLVTGNEELLLERAVREIVAAAAPAPAAGADAAADAVASASASVELEAPRLGAGDIRAAASPSLFGDAPVVVVQGLADLKKKDDDEGSAAAREELLAYLAAPDPQAVVVLVHGGGSSGRDLVAAAKKAGARTVDVSSPAKSKTGQLASHRRQFVVAEFRRLGLQVTPQAADLLVVAVGSDLRSLAGACAQLAADAGLSAGSRIDADLVGRYYAGRAEVDAFAISDHLLRGRTAQALALLRQMLAHDPMAKVGPLLVGGIAWTLRQRAGQRPADGWSPDALATALRAVAAADAAVKGGEADSEYALERMLIAVGRARTARA